MFDKELAFFIRNQDALVKEHNGKTLILRGDELVGVAATPLEAYLEAQKRFELGTFMLQPCKPGREAYTVTLAGR